MTQNNTPSRAPAPNAASRLKTAVAFCRELWREHEFWVEALAVKGGASAVVVAAAVVISHAVALPFLVAALTIGVCGGLLGLGIYGMVAGTRSCWKKLHDIYGKVTGSETPAPEKPAARDAGIAARIAKTPAVKRMIESKTMQRIAHSRPWKVARRITRGQQDNILGGLAIGGSVLSLAVGVLALTTQLVILPFIAIGGLLTASVVVASTSLVTGISGLYFSIVGMRARIARKKSEAFARRAKRKKSDIPPSLPEKEATPAAALPAPLSPAFDSEAEKLRIPPPANDAAPVPDITPLAGKEKHSISIK